MLLQMRVVLVVVRFLFGVLCAWPWHSQSDIVAHCIAIVRIHKKLHSIYHCVLIPIYVMIRCVFFADSIHLNIFICSQMKMKMIKKLCDGRSITNFNWVYQCEKSFVKHSMENYIINSNIRHREIRKRGQGETNEMEICQKLLHTNMSFTFGKWVRKNLPFFREIRKIFYFHLLALDLQEFFPLFIPLETSTHTDAQHSRAHVSIDRTTFTPSSIDARTHEHIWYCFCGSFALIIENDMCVCIHLCEPRANNNDQRT